KALRELHSDQRTADSPSRDRPIGAFARNAIGNPFSEAEIDLVADLVSLRSRIGNLRRMYKKTLGDCESTRNGQKPSASRWHSAGRSGRRQLPRIAEKIGLKPAGAH